MSLSAPLVFGATLAAFVLLHVTGWRIAGKLGPRRRFAAGLLALCISLPGAWFAFYYLHLLPEPPLLYELRSLPMSEGFLALLGLAAGIWRVILPAPLKLLSTAGAVFILTIPFLKAVFQPVDLSGLSDTWEDDACIQSSMVTCGPASSASILRYLGNREIQEGDLAKAAWTSKSGTEAWHLARAIKRLGYRVSFSTPPGLPGREALPAMIGTGGRGAGHFVAVLEIDGDEVVFVDPLRGKDRMARARFVRWYQLEPFCMSIAR